MQQKEQLCTETAERSGDCLRPPVGGPADSWGGCCGSLSTAISAAISAASSHTAVKPVPPAPLGSPEMREARKFRDPLLVDLPGDPAEPPPLPAAARVHECRVAGRVRRHAARAPTAAGRVGDR